MRVSVMVPTHNRVRELRRTLAMVHGLSAAPIEVLVTADGCNDGTEEMIKGEFPETRLRVNREAVGSVGARDWMMRHANGDLVLALDDDSYPEQRDCIARVVPLFEENPLLAVVHFPQRTDEYRETLTQRDFGQPGLRGTFANSGAVIRRAHYLALEGFEPRFFHMYEEPDFGLQCVAAGYEVLFTPVVTIRHHYSAEARSELRNHRQHARNEFWSTVRRCPLPYVFGVLAWRAVSQFRYACTRGPGWAMQEPLWWAQALSGIGHCLWNRRPVPWGSYKRWLELGMDPGTGRRASLPEIGAMKWICVQDGAREHYALPRALHREGRLELVATEFWGGRALRKVRMGPMQALASRWHRDLEGAKITSWNTRYLLRRLSRAVIAKDNSYEAFVRNGRWLSERVRNWLERHEVELGGKVVFSYDTTALELFEFARERGAMCVLGQMDPSRVELEEVREEEKRWPGWALRRIEVPEEYLARREQEWALADRVMVNSEFCRQALVRQGVPEEKLVVVPLCYENEGQCGVVARKEMANGQWPMADSQSPMAKDSSTKEGAKKDRAFRVLFLGQVILRKGIQYLVEAAKLLREENVHFDVVGPSGISDAAMKSAPPNVIFHGRVMRDKASEWYRRANVFVLPTLSDGFAITQLEAMAHGLPVIATPNCGDVVTHGVDGFVVPTRDSAAVASAIVQYMEAPAMLTEHSSAAVSKAARFGLQSLSQKLQELERETAHLRSSDANPHQRLAAKISVGGRC